MTLACPSCEAVAPDNDRFCEVCGAELPPASPLPQEDVDPALLCPKCKAGPAEIDHEGFCAGCGFRREERGRDHLEICVSARLAGVTDRGLRHHRNEDYLALRDTGQSAVLVVCDGVSSAQQPDLAAAVAAERACLALEESLAGEMPLDESGMQAEMEAALSAAQSSVASLPFEGLNAPATTIVAAAYEGEQVILGWLGDSRAYWIDAAGTQSITVDHSLRDQASPKQDNERDPALETPRSHLHAITAWLGADAPAPASTHILTWQPPGPGSLLLCSDGFWNYAPDPATISELVRAVDGGALAVCQHLIAFARGKGGNDNITVAVLSIGEAPL